MSHVINQYKLIEVHVKDEDNLQKNSWTESMIYTTYIYMYHIW